MFFILHVIFTILLQLEGSLSLAFYLLRPSKWLIDHFGPHHLQEAVLGDNTLGGADEKRIF